MLQTPTFEAELLKLGAKRIIYQENPELLGQVRGPEPEYDGRSFCSYHDQAHTVLMTGSEVHCA